MGKELLRRQFGWGAVTLLFEPRDLYIGVYWDSQEWVWGRTNEVFVCLIPMLPVSIAWDKMRDV